MFIYIVYKLNICKPLLLLKLRRHLLFHSSELLSVKEKKKNPNQTTNPCQFQHLCPYD